MHCSPPPFALTLAALDAGENTSRNLRPGRGDILLPSSNERHSSFLVERWSPFPAVSKAGGVLRSASRREQPLSFRIEEGRLPSTRRALRSTPAPSPTHQRKNPRAVVGGARGWEAWCQERALGGAGGCPRHQQWDRFSSTAAHAVAAVHALVARAAPHGDLAADIARRRIARSFH